MSATTMAVAVAVETVGRNTPLAFAVVMVRPTPQYAACLYYRREVNAFHPDLRLFPVQTCPWIRRFMGLARDRPRRRRGNTVGGAHTGLMFCPADGHSSG